MKSVIIIALLFVLVITITAFSQASSEILEIEPYKSTETKITGKIPDRLLSRGIPVEIQIINPDGIQDSFGSIPTKQGTFEHYMIFDSNSKVGEYKVSVIYKGEVIQKNSIKLIKTGFESITNETPEKILIPEWIKNNVKWWADGAIDDDSFVSGIEFLISEGTIDVPITQKTVSTTDKIPSWIRTNAEWWADGVITDSDFVKGIEFLANSGIIQVNPSTQAQIDPPSLEIEAGPSDDSDEIIQESWMCSGNAGCFTGIVTSVIDGDTIKVDGKSIRFAMASAPELNEPGGIEAREFIETICSVGSIATVDEDDGQTQGNYGRILGVIYCNGFNLNADLLDLGYGYLISDFCDDSEFVNEDWAQKHGCSTSSEPDCPTSHPYLWSDGFCYDASEFLDNGCPRDYPFIWSDGLCYNLPEPVYEEPVYEETPRCDPSYPDICIASYPPDLDCDEIPYTDFRVYQPDPHGFDADYDGIGCESYSPPTESTPPPTESTSVDCDPSYPDFCIPSPPPDLDCGDIPYKRFTVLQPDPHRFDGDKDGIGCES